MRWRHCIPVFEVLSSRFVNRKLTDPLSNIADLQSCGAVVVGPACRDWKQSRCQPRR